MSLADILIGKPLPTWDERGEQIGVAAGIPIFGLDALSSAAYGPEAALTLLIPLGAAGVAYIVPVSLGIIALLDDRLFLVPPDDRGVSGRGRIVHGGVGEPGCLSGPAGGGGVDAGLRAGGGSGNFGGSGRAGFGGPAVPAAHAGDLLGDTCGDHAW